MKARKRGKISLRNGENDIFIKERISPQLSSSMKWLLGNSLLYAILFLRAPFQKKNEKKRKRNEWKWIWARFFSRFNEIVFQPIAYLRWSRRVLLYNAVDLDARNPASEHESNPPMAKWDKLPPLSQAALAVCADLPPLRINQIAHN